MQPKNWLDWMLQNFKRTVQQLKKQSLDRRKSNFLSNPHSRPHVVSNSSEYENTFPRNNFVSGDVTYADAAKYVQKIFDRAQTKLYQNFDRELNAGHVKIKTFPSANSREFSQYFTPTLEDSNFDAVILLRNRN